MTDKARALQEKKQKLAAKKELRASGDAAQAASATPPESPGKTDKALALERKKADLAARKAARASGSGDAAQAPGTNSRMNSISFSNSKIRHICEQVQQRRLRNRRARLTGRGRWRRRKRNLQPRRL